MLKRLFCRHKFQAYDWEEKDGKLIPYSVCIKCGKRVKAKIIAFD